MRNEEMKKIKKVFPVTLLACLLPLSAHADLYVYNTTTVDATAYSPYYESCSGSFRSIGIIKAHPTKATPIKQGWVDTFCDSRPCDAEVHMSLDCSGNSVGLVRITKLNGVDWVKNTDVDGYRVRKIDDKTLMIERTEALLPKFLY
jgi:hypothetical protein